MRYTENFKKGMVRLIISTGISYKKLSEMTEISQPTLKKWDDEYHQQILDDKKREAERLKKQEEENIKRVGWHQYGSGAGRYE
ncbi:transposase [Anaerostipes faecalis]|uniref:transposase n=1 Tax=Anaerostipes faecalis TaxID=2738446 RepID=UPI003F000FFD